MARDLPSSLVYARSWPLVGRLAYYALKLLGVEIPRRVPVGPGFELAHGGVGVVIHSKSSHRRPGEDLPRRHPGAGGYPPPDRAIALSKGLRSRMMSSWPQAPRCCAKRAYCASGAARWWAPTPSFCNPPARTKSGPVCPPNVWGSVSAEPKRTTRICLVPRLAGVGGMVSFQYKLADGLRARGLQVCQDLSDAPYQAVLVIGGTRDLAGLWRARRQGIPVVQRLDGMNWLHRLAGMRQDGWRHYLRAEYGNRLLALIRSRLASRIVYQSEFARRWWERIHGPLPVENRVIHNGVDLNSYSPSGVERPSGRPLAAADGGRQPDGRLRAGFAGRGRSIDPAGGLIVRARLPCRTETGGAAGRRAGVRKCPAPVADAPRASQSWAAGQLELGRVGAA